MISKHNQLVFIFPEDFMSGGRQYYIANAMFKEPIEMPIV